MFLFSDSGKKSFPSSAVEEVVPKSGIEDIDADTSDPFMVAEYAYEVFQNMKGREVMFLVVCHKCVVMFVED